jgi:hypothetical protein
MRRKVMEIKLSQIRHVDIKKLKVNENNEKFFRPESGKGLDNLIDDIKERGIQVPLVARKDGTLLAGHNRLLAAKNLKIDTVPVQYVVDELTPDQEKEYIIKDNVLRRHLLPEERRALYNYLVPDFEEAVKHRSSKNAGVNIHEIAEKSGLNPRTINYDMSMIRHQKEKERIQGSAVDIADMKAIEGYKRSVSKMLNVAILGSEKTNDELYNISKLAIERLEGVREKFTAEKELKDRKAVLKPKVLK